MIVSMQSPNPPDGFQFSTIHDAENVHWQAVTTRDARFDGKFVYAVVTTGIFCKPSCPSRKPSRRNICYFSSGSAAQQSGFRACLRCRPLLQQSALAAADSASQVIQSACRWMEQHAGSQAGYAHLAARAGMGAAHFHRTFKRVVGVTPKRYADSVRLQHFKAGLKQGGSVTGNMYDSGFGSSSRLYERTNAHLGMTPRQYRSRGAGVAMSYVTADTTMGPILLAATDRGICFLQFGRSADELIHALQTEFPLAQLQAAVAHADLDAWTAVICDYLAGVPLPTGLPLDIEATSFQLRVWDYLQTIPAGQSRSYSQVAAELGKPTATRAIANACARNRIALLIPCHRVLRSNGELGGYRWGLQRKGALLTLEQRTAQQATPGSQTPASPYSPLPSLPL